MRLTKLHLTLLSIASVVLVLLFACILALVFRDSWVPTVKELIHGPSATADDHADHPAHDDSASLELSEQARRNIGLKTGVVEPQPYERTIVVPAMVVERSGRSQVDVTAPMTGIVTRIYIIEAEAIEPGQPLFDIRLTHEELVTSQRDFLKALEELDVVRSEIDRLAKLKNVIEGKRQLEKQYEKQILDGTLLAQHQGLLLHGLSEAQIQGIARDRKLLQSLTVVAPPYAEHQHHQDFEHLYHVQSISVKRGQHVAAGDTVSVLGDHCELYLEGKAFEQDAERLTEAAKEGWPVKAVLIGDGERRGDLLPLRILYVADQVESDSRALHFYMTLPNELGRDTKSESHRFIGWKFRPGQRMEVRVPIERWEKQIVLPTDAVVQEGPDAFVFEQNGDHFDRVPVHIEYRDRDWVVIENDGALVGSTVATSGAYQMQLALKNKAGGGIDPHAGHNH
jgi:cobalt-zinc-cadmium efflux system membrane fusion protein